jgi:hypothetical protein
MVTLGFRFFRILGTAQYKDQKKEDRRFQT